MEKRPLPKIFFGTERTVEVGRVPDDVLVKLLDSKKMGIVTMIYEWNYFSPAELEAEAEKRGMVYMLLGWK
jgi:hypothetical protein